MSSLKGDSIFGYNEEKVDALYGKRPWVTNPRFVQNCKISALASMKMLKHALSGVTKGKATLGFPVEVMGLLIGKPEGDTIIVMDVAPLPIEGEAAFVSAQGKVQNYMINLMEAMEKNRQEGFVGWYHSHPFDVGTHPTWFLSNVDMQTQNTYQMGSPLWTSIVIDPLRSVAKQYPELGVFRAFPSKVPDSKLMPDGEVPPSEEFALLRWHDTWRRYYVVKHQFFMSSLSINFLKIMSRNVLWIRALANEQATDKDYRAASRKILAESVKSLKAHSARAGGGRGGGKKTKEDPYTAAAVTCCELASDHCTGHASTIAKQIIFNLAKSSSQRRIAREKRLLSSEKAAEKTAN